jgi:hypothetical protein
MKTKIYSVGLLILLLLLFFKYEANGQSYHKLIEGKDKYWDIAFYEQGNICGNTGFPIRYFINGDTIINDLTYSKVYSYPFLAVDPKYGTCPPYLVDTNYYLTNIFIREDTLLKKVYRYFPEQDTDGLLFDFSLNIHDTLKYYDYPSGFGIVTIDTIIEEPTFDHIIRKQFITNICFSCNYTEGIGGVQGPFDLPFIFENFYYIMCVADNNNEIYGYRCYDFISGIKTQNIHNKTISLYPNPANTEITFRLNFDQEYLVQLFNTSGIYLSDFFITKESPKIYISNLEPGFYFLKVFTKNKFMATSHFIKI